MAASSYRICDFRTESITVSELEAIRVRRWVGRSCGANLARVTVAEFDRLAQAGEFGDNPARPSRHKVAEYRLNLDPPSPYLDALAYDHVLTVGSPCPEVSEWARPIEDMGVEHHHTLVEAVVRASELRVLPVVVVNNPAFSFGDLTAFANLARFRFPSAALYLFGYSVSPQLATAGWDYLPPDTADLVLAAVYDRFNKRFGPVRSVSRPKKKANSELAASAG